MKTILLIACTLTLFSTSGCFFVGDGRHGHARFEGPPAIIVGPPPVIVRPPEIIVR